MVATEPIDFRKGADGIAQYCRQKFNSDPRSGILFVFTNRARTMIRVLFYDGNGYWLATKRLSKGKFSSWKRVSSGLENYSSTELIQQLQMVVKKNQ
jgi:transposase